MFLATLCCAGGFIQRKLVYCCTSLQSAMQAVIKPAMTVINTLKPLTYWGSGIKLSRIFNESKNVYVILCWWECHFQPKCIYLVGIFFWKMSVLDSQGCCEVTATDLEAELWCFTKKGLVSTGGNWGTSWFLIQSSPLSQEESPVTRLQIQSARRVIQYFIQHRTGKMNSASELALWCMPECQVKTCVLCLLLPKSLFPAPLLLPLPCPS